MRRKVETRRSKTHGLGPTKKTITSTYHIRCLIAQNNSRRKLLIAKTAVEEAKFVKLKAQLTARDNTIQRERPIKKLCLQQFCKTCISEKRITLQMSHSTPFGVPNPIT
eukprot:g72359.t1